MKPFPHYPGPARAPTLPCLLLQTHLRAPPYTGFCPFLIWLYTSTYARTDARTPTSISPLQFPSVAMQYIWHLENARQQHSTIYLTNISCPAEVHGIFMKGTWQPVFSAAFMGNTAKCSRYLPTFPKAAILPGPQELCWPQSFYYNELIFDEAEKHFF